MIAHLNATQALHIVTVEDPVEFLHTDAMSSVSQREVARISGVQPGTVSKCAQLLKHPDV